MQRRTFRVLRFLVIATAALLGGLWAVRPFLRPPQGLHPTDWTYSQLVRDRYPLHLVSPDWLSDEVHWILAETAVRIVIVAGGILATLVLVRITRSEKPA
jgi:hypothetical protein